VSEAGQERGVCLVVGAGDGLGASIARAFAREGLRVCVTRRPRNTGAVDKLADAIRAEGGEAGVIVDSSRKSTLSRIEELGARIS
jgi:NAD(P)-dependent dehydrogenase (short-subunit alcohol dehydrogenase family)